MELRVRLYVSYISRRSYFYYKMDGVFRSTEKTICRVYYSPLIFLTRKWGPCDSFLLFTLRSFSVHLNMTEIRVVPSPLTT